MSKKFKVLVIVIVIVVVIFSAERSGCHATKFDEETFRMAGGFRPPTNDIYKPLVSIRLLSTRKYFGDTNFCGGSIIGPKTILTAAHCVCRGQTEISVKPSMIKVVVGTPRRLNRTPQTQIIRVRSIVKHEEFNMTTLFNDIAILHLVTKIFLNNVSAAMISVSDENVEVGVWCYAIGWGNLFFHGPAPNEALAVHLQILPFCYVLYANERVICAINTINIEQTTCQGDSGGPLVCNDKLQGIISSGYDCAIGVPSFFTNVFYYKDWIAKNNNTGSIVKAFPLTFIHCLLLTITLI